MLEQKLTDYIMPDVTWTGGITELKKISALAEAYYIPISPHDAGGPINILAGSHVMMTVPNFYKLETNRWDLSGYNELMHTRIDTTKGIIRLPDVPGLGIEMNRDYLEANEVELAR